MPPSTIEYTGRKLRVQGSELRVAAADRDRNLALGGRKHPHFARLGTKCWTVVDLQARLSLPLVHHLVQQCVLDLAPVMPPDVSPTHTDFFGLPVLVHHQLTETALHPAGKPNGYLTKGTTEMKEVKSAMGVFQPLQRDPVLRAGPFVTPRPMGQRDVRRDGKSEELPFRCTTPDARHPWIHELNDGPQHVIRREG